jgi:hypothetical protein
VIQFRSAWVLKAEHLAALRIGTGHNVPDGAVFADGIHGQKNQQLRIMVRAVMKTL